MSVLDWVIVGGGPHGVCAARALQANGAQLRIIDPAGELLQRWSARARAVGMTWMRSPVSHHVDRHPTDLHHFLHRRDNADVANLARPFLRPLHAAFLRHAQHVIAREGLQRAVVRGRVEALQRDGDSLVVEGDGVLLRTRRVLVATGSNQVRIPEWARQLQAQGAAIHHVFGRGPQLANDIVGGGISAVQCALDVWRRTRQLVRLWIRRPIHIADFDTEQLQTRSRFVGRWSRLKPDQRCALLKGQDHRGRVPPGLWTRLSQAIARGRVQLREGGFSVQRVRAGQLVLCGEAGSVETDGLTLATGLRPEQLGGWLRKAADRLDLPVQANLPRLQRDMHWGRGVYVCGPLSRLRLGPMASNLIGARWATSLLPGVTMQPY